MDVPRLAREELRGGEIGDSSAEIRGRVATAREVQNERQGVPNSALAGRKLREVCSLGDEAEMLFSRAIDRMGLSGRAHDRILRVARTIADLAGETEIGTQHLAEALNFRRAASVSR